MASGAQAEPATAASSKPKQPEKPGKQGQPGQPGQPGQQRMVRPTQDQIRALQQQLAKDAEAHGMTVPQYIEILKKRQMAAQQAQAQAQGQGQGQGQAPGQVQAARGHRHGPGQAAPAAPGPPNPTALALAAFLRSQNLKLRTCILNGERRDMFRVKRALRVLQSPDYEKARKKTPSLPEITDHASLQNTFKLLPLSMLALRVNKVDPQAGHGHGPAKRVKGLWTVRIEQQQEAEDDMYYVWLWEGSQAMRKVYAALALAAIFAITLYPLWPVKLRQGVYYLTWVLLGVLGLFFAMAIFRVILFSVTYFVVSPGLWLYPNLWEDVSFLDSFRPVWAWHETTKSKKKKAGKKSSGDVSTSSAREALQAATPGAVKAEAKVSGSDTVIATSTPQPRNYAAPQVEELSEDE